MKKIILSSLLLVSFGSSCYAEDYSDEVAAVANGAIGLTNAIKGTQTVVLRNTTIDNQSKNEKVIQINSTSGIDMNGANVDASDSDIFNNTDNRESLQINSTSGVKM
jgi:opacity protein-like surface antigen